jgi:hypothetical protein
LYFWTRTDDDPQRADHRRHEDGHEGQGLGAPADHPRPAGRAEAEGSRRTCHLVDKETAELQVLEGYLPQRLGADEIAAEVAKIVAETGASGPGDMGKVMGAVKTRLAGKADMSLVSAAVKQALAK